MSSRSPLSFSAPNHMEAMLKLNFFKYLHILFRGSKMLKLNLHDDLTADSQTDRNFKGKKPNLPANKGPSLIELSGYNEKRQEFDPEYDNEAEQLLAEMEFKDADGEDERELKMRVLRIYSKR